MKLIACLLMLALSACANAQPPFAKIEQFTGRLELPDGTLCSGTRDGNAIITSRHCMEGPSRQVRFQGILANVTRVWIHGENIWVYTDRNWGPAPKFGAPPAKGDALYIIGNAAGFDQLARVANLAGRRDAKNVPNALLIACGNCWHGDSGAGIFNADGELVGVYLGGYSFYAIENQGTKQETLSVFALSIAVPIR